MNPEISVGYGENHFTMSRGSFRYRMTTRKRRRLVPVRREKVEDGEVLILLDEKEKEEYRFRLRKGQGRVQLKLEGELPEGVNRVWLTIPTNKEEHIYGCGETYSKFDLKGEKVRIWVAEHQNSRRISKKIIMEKLIGKHPGHRLPFSRYESYYAQPTFTSSDKYFIHVNTNGFSEFDFTNPERITFALQEAPDILMEQADSFEELSEKMGHLLGHPGKLPAWVFDGAIVAVQEGCDAVDRKLANARKAGVKINGVWCQDWCGCRRTGFGYQVMWNWKADETLYPNLQEKIQEWKKQGVRFLGYINPFIALEKDLYKEAAEKGYLVKDKEGKDYLVTITTFPAAMVDFTNPDAYRWYKNLIKENLIGIGMGGWMADFGEYLPVDCVLYDGSDPALIHNRWPAIWAKMNREAIAECGKEEEVFFFTRAGHTGTIANSTLMWTGDQHVDWSVDDGLPSVIPATLSLAMSGFGLTHSDVGGYTTIMHMRRTKELLMRWEEMNAFSPVYRSHEGNQPVNNVQFDDDEELLQHLKKCVNWYGNLKDYLQNCIKELEEKATPVMRPLFYHYDEPGAYSEMTEYLLGRDILVAPVLVEGAKERNCYLPKDEWVHIFTGKEYQGGVCEVEAPVGCPPVFVRKNSFEYEALMRKEWK